MQEFFSKCGNSSFRKQFSIHSGSTRRKYWECIGREEGWGGFQGYSQEVDDGVLV